MIFRKATTADIDSITQIIAAASARLGAAGIDQWQRGYPNRASVERDVEAEVGMVLLPNDRYPLDRDVFRLYYTSECEDQQPIDVYFEDNHDQVYQLTFTFNNEAKEEEDTTEGNTITPIGTIVSPININP